LEFTDAAGAAGVFKNDGDGNVSLFRVENDSQIERILAAFVLGFRERIQRRACVIVDESHLKSIAHKLNNSELGKTPDSIVNSWHWNLLRPNQKESFEVAFAFGKFGVIKEFSIDQLLEHAFKSIESGNITTKNLTPLMQSYLAKKKPQ